MAALFVESHPMNVTCFPLSAFMTNCYLVTSNDGRHSLIIDAPEEIERLIQHCDDHGLQPSMLINTHGHVDHMAGNAAVKARWPDLRLAIGEGDVSKLSNSLSNLSLLLMQPITSPEPDVVLHEGDTVPLGDEELNVLETPGHTAGGITLVARPKQGPPLAFVGDTLFCQSIGRTDFPGGNTRTLMTSIREKLLTLPDETICYSGHGPETTIGDERRNNPYLR